MTPETTDSSKKVVMRDIVKRFPDVLANDHVTLKANKREIHALLGENGAGKTTLMNVLYGLYNQDKGKILIDGKPVQIDSPKDAMDLGIGMVHQHFKLVPPHTVAENVTLGLSDTSFWKPTEDVISKLGALSERYGLEVDPNAKVRQLSAGGQQRVEILKALYRDVTILILDEPTSALTPQETEKLFKVMERIKDEGNTIFFITHKLKEVMQIADRTTVMRDGKVVNALSIKDVEKQDLARMMVGENVGFEVNKELKEGEEVVLHLDDVRASDDKGISALKDISFRLRKGEILGVAGVAGNGQRELVETITGLRDVDAGNISILGQDMMNQSPRQVADSGVAHIPEDRMVQGIVPDLSVKKNLILKKHHKPPFSKGPFLQIKKIEQFAKDSVEDSNIVTPGIEIPAKLLSGGNIQRLILARELSGKPELVVASHPTHGLDVSAVKQVRKLLVERRNRGVGVLLVSEDLDEILMLSDRVLVMFEGEVMGILSSNELDREKIGYMMAGHSKQEDL